MKRTRAEEILDAMKGRRILVVGDLMLDRYVSGTVSRISPEAPVPVVHVRNEHAQPGGAANVSLNIQSLGGCAVTAGILGVDAAGDELTRVLAQYGCPLDGLLRSPGCMTTVKTRVVAERQQVVRVDREAVACFDEAETVMAFCRRLEAVCSGVDGMILEDYGKGVVSQPVVDVLERLSGSASVPLGLDPKENHTLKFSQIELASPNLREACLAAGVPEFQLEGDPLQSQRLRNAALRLKSQWNVRFLMITLGPHGMYLLHSDGAVEVIPTRAREVYDVSGAGDTVIATCMLALSAGASDSEAAQLANAAAGIVVGKLGTAVCTPAEILQAMEV